MKVSLISHTPDARELLLFTKKTRLSMSSKTFEEIRSWPEERKAKELAYMLGTIQSSWEFVDYVFSFEDVSRAFTHQLVRTREASYAQQSQRTVDMEDFEYVTPGAFPDGSEVQDAYHQIMEGINNDYRTLREKGAAPQDARAVLPTNVSTNILAKANLRTLSNMAKTRLCSRTQGEYQDAFRLARLRVIEVHPWTEPFIRVHCAALGVCAFPNYTECPIKPGIFNPETGLVWPGSFDDSKRITVYSDATAQAGIRPLNKSEIQERWEGMKYESIPRSEMK